MVLDSGEGCMDQVKCEDVGRRSSRKNKAALESEPPANHEAGGPPETTGRTTTSTTSSSKPRAKLKSGTTTTTTTTKREQTTPHNGLLPPPPSDQTTGGEPKPGRVGDQMVEKRASKKSVTSTTTTPPCRPPLLRPQPLSLEVTPPPRYLRGSQEQIMLADGRVLQPPWRSGGAAATAAAPSPPARSLTSPCLGGPRGPAAGGGPAAGRWMRRSESTCSVNYSLGLRANRGSMLRPATSLPHIARGVGSSSSSSNTPLPSPSGRPCLLVALRPLNLAQEKEIFFQSDYKYEPQFEYSQPEPTSVLEKYKEGAGLFLEQAVGIMECVLRKFGNYESFEEVTGGSVLPKSRVWAAARKYLQKEGCVGEVVVCLSDELLSQAVMMVERCRPTLTINLAGARQHWLEGMLRHEIGTHYLRGVNNNLQPWATAVGRKKFGLKPANPTEEGLASLHSVLLRKQPYLWRAALLYYTVHHAASMGFSQLFAHIARFVQNPDVRWEYCLRAKRGQTDTSEPGCFSKDQVYLDGILRILRHRKTIDFKMLTSLGKVSFEDVDMLRPLAVLHRARIPHFMQDPERYLQHLDNIVEVNELDDAQLRHLLP